MNAGVHGRCRIALVDSDALQRICTDNSLRALGACGTSFGGLPELAAAIRAGHRFDAVVVGLHADAAQAVAAWSEVEAAAGRRLPLLYLAHPTELDALQRLPANMLTRKSFRLLASPVDEGALLAWLDALVPGAKWA